MTYTDTQTATYLQALTTHIWRTERPTKKRKRHMTEASRRANRTKR